MKKLVSAAAICLAGAMMLTGCAGGGSTAESGSSSSGSSSSSTADAKYKVLIGCSNKAQSFYSWLADATEQELKNNYPDVTCDIFDIEGDDSNVLSMIELAETGGYNGMIVDIPTESVFTQQFQEAKDNGIYAVLTNKTHEADGVVTYVGLNNYNLGYSLGEVAAEELPENAKMLVIPGPGDTCGLDRKNGFFEALEDAGRSDVTILSEQNAVDWQKENGMSIMEDWTQRFGEDDFDAIFCSNDDLAVGCIEVCEAAGYDTQTLQFYGIDGLANGCNAIKDGTMTATALQDCNKIAEEAAAALYSMMTGEDTEGTQILVDPTIITSDNVDEILAMYEENGMLK